MHSFDYQCGLFNQPGPQMEKGPFSLLKKVQESFQEYIKESPGNKVASCEKTLPLGIVVKIPNRKRQSNQAKHWKSEMLVAQRK